MKIQILLCLLLPATLWAQKPVFTTAKTDAVTVYANGVEMSQSISVALPAGVSQIVVKNVSNQLNEATVQVSTPPSVTVLSVQFTKDYISEYDQNNQSSALKNVRDSVKLVQNQLAQISNQRDGINGAIRLLDNNNSNRATINTDELTKLVNYYKTQYSDLKNNLLVLDDKQAKLQEQLRQLNAQLTTSDSKDENVSQGKLILQVTNAADAGNVPFQIRYASGGATWTPVYDLRVDNISSPVNVLYKAQVAQNTGVDWKKVKLTLSSGTPDQNTEMPTLDRWFLSYKQPRLYDEGLAGSAAGVVVTGYGVAKSKKDNETDVVVSATAPPQLEISSINSTISENQLNVSFDISTPYDILSNGKANNVTLKDFKIPATYQYYSIPKLDAKAYLVAQISDYAQYNLLRGDANVIFENMYAGKTTIDPSNTDDTLKLSLGADERISVKREKVADKSGSKFLSSYKEQTFTYDITVRNNKKDPVNLILKDQYPLSTDKDITIDLLDDGKADVDKDSGFLTWQLQLAPNESKKLRFSYKVRSAKDKTIDNL